MGFLLLSLDVCNDSVSLAGHLLQLKRLKISVEIRIFRNVINVFNYKELQ